MSKPTVTIRTVEDKERIIPAEEYQGLCSTCENAADCVFRQSQKDVVQYCEEYTNVVAKPAHHPKEESEPVGDNSSGEEERPQKKGLCMNCEKRDSCGYANSEVGIWHCEEYE